jgi:hypothetical protein
VVCFLVSFDRSDISTHQEWVLLLLKVHFCIEFFDFHVWAWWAPEGKWRLNCPSTGLIHKIFFYCLCLLLLTILLRKMAPNFDHVKRAADSSKEPRTGSGTSFNVIPPKQHLHGRCLGLLVRAMTVAAEIIIAQLHSQSNLTTAWHKNRKIR